VGRIPYGVGESRRGVLRTEEQDEMRQRLRAGESGDDRTPLAQRLEVDDRDLGRTIAITSAACFASQAIDTDRPWRAML
jgi:hypothetical protein